MKINNISNGFRFTSAFADGNSTINVPISNNRGSTGFLLLKAISDNDSFYGTYSIIIKDDGNIALSTINTQQYYDLSISITTSTDNIILNIVDGAGGGTNGGTLTLETILV